MNYLEKCQEWFRAVVLGENLCPFAHEPAEGGRVHWEICEDEDETARLEFFLAELGRLVNADPSKIQTSVIVYPMAEASFEEFYDFVGECEELLVQADATDWVQVVGFHPRFRFANSKLGDLSVFVNRSPVPMIHLLRVADLEAIDSDVGKKVSKENANHLNELGLEGLLERFGHLLPPAALEDFDP